MFKHSAHASRKLLYYPCVFNPRTSRIDLPVGKAMSRESAENVLKRKYRRAWLDCDAIPQPVTHPYFKAQNGNVNE